MIWFARLNFLMCLFISFSSHCHHTLPSHRQLCSSPSSSFDHQNKISSYIFFYYFQNTFLCFSRAHSAFLNPMIFRDSSMCKYTDKTLSGSAEDTKIYVSLVHNWNWNYNIWIWNNHVSEIAGRDLSLVIGIATSSPTVCGCCLYMSQCRKNIMLFT